MKTTVKLLAMLATVMALAACNPEETFSHERNIVYTVNGNISTVNLKTESEWVALLDRFCDYAQEASTVTFRNTNNVAKSTKETVTYSTTSREEMKRWMTKMEDAGMTVTISYDPTNGIWNGRAYNLPEPVTGTGKKVSRVTMDIPGNPGFHTVYTYTWYGDLLTNVDMMQLTTNGNDVDSIHNTAVLSYNNGIRTAMYIYDGDGNMVREFQYTYDNGRLYQEFQTDYGMAMHNVTSEFNYNEYLVRDWCFCSDYLSFVANRTSGLYFVYNNDGNHNGYLPTDYNYVYPFISYVGENWTWNNGDLMRTVSNYNVLGRAFEYDNSPKPYGVTLGTTTLLPGYNTYMPFIALWSEHNLTHIYGQAPETWITYTYNTDGSIATAEMPWRYENTIPQHQSNNSIIYWTFEYLN